MDKALQYLSFKNKSPYFFEGSYSTWFKIENRDDFEEWYAAIKKHAGREHFFRGVSEAKFKLLTSSQLNWIRQYRKNSGTKNYRTFFKEMIACARKEPLLNKVMDFYKLDRDENTFSFMSLLQHYRGVTPFLDWTFNIDIALFFAMDEPGDNIGNRIENYASVYWIDNNLAKIKLLEPGEYAGFHEMLDGNRIGTIETEEEAAEKKDEAEEKDKLKKSVTRLRFLAESTLVGHTSSAEQNKPYSLSVFNQNIITQEGLFIFNPSRRTPLEEFRFSARSTGNTAIQCFNIHKKLKRYILKKLKEQNVTRDLIYPRVDKAMLLLKERINSEFFK